MRLTRRALLACLGSAGLGWGAVGLPGGRRSLAQASSIRTRPIPQSGEPLPVIGLGTWITFNVGGNATLEAERTEVLRAFFAEGGGIIDSSPMYGSSEAVIGHGLRALPPAPGLFSASKVWTPLKWLGEQQMEASRKLWGLERFDLMQVHNLVDWEVHLETLKDWKAEGKIRYLGVTTSHGRRHEELERILREQPLDFVQLTYNILDRAAEARLLPLAAERGIAVIANRPFQGGALLDRAERHPLPPWAAEVGAANWPEYLLKFIVSHPAVTCAIPATSRVDHLKENMGAGYGKLPEPADRRRMAAYVENL